MCVRVCELRIMVGRFNYSTTTSNDHTQVVRDKSRGKRKRFRGKFSEINSSVVEVRSSNFQKERNCLIRRSSTLKFCLQSLVIYRQD
ncbi:hypothetical protein CEXT_149661 [Caerostris extrusa]|uniref:Uncharacterized protein n=1 Tax=Caerostris extrusa TaxID=172846 RepID=A0AAV4XPU0_CAEEX|nr:hypothetical protein CEXT_149661 [Caerostris extrusa]